MEDGYCESFNSKFRDALLAREIFYDLQEAEILIHTWCQHYYTARPRSSLGYRPPPPTPSAVLSSTFMPPCYWEAPACTQLPRNRRAKNLTSHL